MNTPEYPATIIVGGTSQTTQFAALPSSLVNRQSGTVILIYNKPDNTPHDISSLSGADFKSVPWDSGETPTTLASGVVGYSQEIFTLTTSDTPDTAGTFILRVAGEDTAAIAFDATAAIILAALEALPSRSGGDFVVTIAEKENLSKAGAQLLIETSGGFSISFDSTIDVASLPNASIELKVSQKGSNIQNEYSATWTKDSIPANYSEFDFDKLGAIAFYAALEDGDDFIQNYQRTTIFDDAFTNQGGSLPSSATYIYNPADNNVWLRKAPSAPVTMNAALDILVTNNYLNRTVQSILSTPVGSPVDGDSFLVANSSATGDFLLKENKVATFSSTLSGYTFSNVHKEGDEVLNLADGSIYRVNADNTTWSVPSLLGVGTVTNTELANMAQDTIKGRASTGTGEPEDLNSGQVRSMLSVDQVDNVSDANKIVSDDTQDALDLKVDENTITTAKFNANKLQDKDLDLTGLSDTFVIKYQTAGDKFIVAAESGGGSGITLTPYTFNTTITIGGIVAGEIRFNNASPASVTEIYIHSFDSDGVNLNSLINALDLGNVFKVKQDVSKNIIVTVNSVTDNLDSTFTLGVTPITAGALPDNSGALATGFYFVLAGGSSGLVNFNGRTTPSVTPTLGDYPSTIIGDTSTVGGATAKDSFDLLDGDRMKDTEWNPNALTPSQIVTLTDTQALTNKSINGYTPTVTGSASLFVNGLGQLALPPGASGGEANRLLDTGTGEGISGGFSGVDLLLKSMKAGANMNIIGSATELEFIGTGISAISDATDTDIPTPSEGDLLYYTAGKYKNLGVGTVGQVLKSTGTIPAWQAETGGGGGFPADNIPLTQAANVAIDWSQGGTFEFGTLTMDIIVSFANISQGQTINVNWTSAGGFDVTFPGTITALSAGTTTINSYNAVYIDATNQATEQLATFSTDTASGGSDVEDIAEFQDIQASGVAGTDITNTAAVVPFNTENRSRSWVSLSSNAFTLDEGTYVIFVQDTGNSGTGITAQYTMKDTSDNTNYGSFKLRFDNLNSLLSGGFTFTIASQKTMELFVEANVPITKSLAFSTANISEPYQLIQFKKIG